MRAKAPENQGLGGTRVWSPLELVEVKTAKRPGQIWRAKGATSRRRIKPEHGPMCYHVMSRTVNGEFLFGPTEKEAFRRMMRRMAQFAGVEILTYAVMDNHFHILIMPKERLQKVGTLILKLNLMFVRHGAGTTPVHRLPQYAIVDV